jgi:hypothetical protein
VVLCAIIYLPNPLLLEVWYLLGRYSTT